MCAGSQVVGLLTLMSSLVPLILPQLVSWLLPTLISNCSKPLFGTQGRSWRLESCLQEMRDRKGLHAQEPTGCPWFQNRTYPPE